MDRNFQRALPRVRKHEGGFVNNPKDPGGATNKGVTLATFRAHVKPKGTVEDLKKITDDQVATVFYKNYWTPVMAHQLPSGVDYAVFDYAVNSGPARAAKDLQKVVGVTRDGKVGPATLAAAETLPASEIINRLCDERLAFLKRIKGKDRQPLWKTFGKGWAARVEDVRRTALEWVGKPADVKTVEVPVEVEKKVVPPAVETQVKRKTNLWGWIVGIFTGAGAGVSKLADAEWTTVLAIGGIGIVVLGGGLLMRHQIIAAVRDIRKAVEQ